ncbi:hypothetical protein [Pantoea sp. MQR6]|uniref:hypothetical protein n=1 Tax=Pantoea sp. MQR6 TaxID=2907307 RepID=UPI001FAAC665|nr:hypothetical protein [Pantoea sp. MQR6]
MTNKTIYFIHRPSPTLGRSPLHGGYFPYFLTEKFIKSLQRELDRRGLPWQVMPDDTGSDIEALIARKAALLVCAPGLRFQFYHQGFEKPNIIWLGFMEYVSVDISAIINRLSELVSADT